MPTCMPLYYEYMDFCQFNEQLGKLGSNGIKLFYYSVRFLVDSHHVAGHATKLSNIFLVTCPWLISQDLFTSVHESPSIRSHFTARSFHYWHSHEFCEKSRHPHSRKNPVAASLPLRFQVISWLGVFDMSMQEDVWISEHCSPYKRQTAFKFVIVHYSSLLYHVIMELCTVLVSQTWICCGPCGS